MKFMSSDQRSKVKRTYQYTKQYLYEVDVAFQKTTEEKHAMDELLQGYIDVQMQLSPEKQDYLNKIIHEYQETFVENHEPLSMEGFIEITNRYGRDNTIHDRKTEKIYDYSLLSNDYKRLKGHADMILDFDPDTDQEYRSSRGITSQGRPKSISSNEHVLEERTNFVYDCSILVENLRSFRAEFEYQMNKVYQISIAPDYVEADFEEIKATAIDTSKAVALKQRANKLFDQLEEDLVGAPDSILKYFAKAKRSFIEDHDQQSFDTQQAVEDYVNNLKQFCRTFILELREQILAAAEAKQTISISEIFGDVKAVVNQIGNLVISLGKSVSRSAHGILDSIRQSINSIQEKLEGGGCVTGI